MITDTALTGDYKAAIIAMTPPMNKLLSHYIGWGKAEKLHAKELPVTELNHFLDELDIYYPGANKRKLKLAIRAFITQLTCFKYRVIAKDEKSQHTVAAWNPLEQKYSEFIANHKHCHISYRPNNTPHPVADLISDWVTRNMDEEIYSE